MRALKTRLEKLEETAMVRPDEGLKDVPFETLLWVASGCGEASVEAVPEFENIVRGLFSGPPAQTEFLPLVLRLVRLGLTEETARFVARAAQGKANQAEAAAVDAEQGRATA